MRETAITLKVNLLQSVLETAAWDVQREPMHEAFQQAIVRQNPRVDFIFVHVAPLTRRSTSTVVCLAETAFLYPNASAISAQERCSMYRITMARPCLPPT
jgi:hypothetical protein